MPSPIASISEKRWTRLGELELSYSSRRVKPFAEQSYSLVPHPDHSPISVKSVSMRWASLRDGRAMLRYRVDGRGSLVLPPFAGKGRADGLWQTTCFELFLGQDGPAYFEFNFSPSGRWASYFFPSYRSDRLEPDMDTQPDIHIDQGEEIFVLTAFLSGDDLAGATRAGVSAVIEEAGGVKSYWALAHPQGKPDFHDPACFRRLAAAAHRR